MVTYNQEQYTQLGLQAVNAKKAALPFFSKFHVGAALLTTNNETITGCNIEVSSYSLTICAERTAIFKALSDGHRDFTAIAVASDNPDFLTPCGACRQVISDLCGNIDVVMVNAKHEIKVQKISELLPSAFQADQIIPEAK